MNRPGRTSVVPLILLAPLCAAARAGDDPAAADRERRLEKRVEDLERQLADVSRRLAESGADRSGDELAQRVAELERLTKKDDNGLFAYWKNGIRLDSASGAFKLRIGGRIQSDWSWFPEHADVERATGKQIEAGEEFRRARLQVGGQMYGNVDFMAEYDFASGTTKFRNVWMGITLCDFGHLQVGSFKEPFGFEEQIDDLFISFLERSSGNEAFTPSFNTGAMLSGNCMEDRVAWAAGVFRDANDAGDDTGNNRSGEWNVTGRVAGRPLLSDDGAEWLHVGAGASRRVPPDDMVTFKSRPEMHLAPVLVNTDRMVGTSSVALGADEVLLTQLEAVGALGRFWAGAEWFRTDVHATDGASPVFDALVLQGGCFLTGENRPYNAKRATFDRVIPKKNFDGAGGAGAWEAVARWDDLDLNDAGVHGGRMRIWTAGLNWYLNPNTKVQLDVVRSHTYDVGRLLGVEMRFQVDF